MNPARELRRRLETLHAVTYFDEASIEAAADAGLKGFWMGYFGFRASPMGAVGAATIEAAFANFARPMIDRAVPDVWSFATPDGLISARTDGAAASLRRIIDEPSLEQSAARANRLLSRIVEHCPPLGRPLFSANVGIRFDDPVSDLWQLCTTLREYRGDGHVGALMVDGIDGCQAHVLQCAAFDTPVEMMQRARGWTETDWQEAAHRLVVRSLVQQTDDGLELTADGAALLGRVEAETDRLDLVPLRSALAPGEIEELYAELDPLAAAVAGSGTIPYPNPMGLPRFHG